MVITENVLIIGGQCFRGVHMWLNVNCQFRIDDWVSKREKMSVKDIKGVFENSLKNANKIAWCGIPSEFNQKGDNCLTFNLFNSKNGDYIISIAGDLRHCDSTDIDILIGVLNNCVKKINIDKNISYIKSFVGLIHNGYDLSRTLVMDYEDRKIKEIV